MLCRAPNIKEIRFCGQGQDHLIKPDEKSGLDDLLDRQVLSMGVMLVHKVPAASSIP